MPSQKYLLLAIDGTLSSGAAYRGADGNHRSYVKEFYQDFDTKGGDKKYWDGPEAQMGATGWDAYSIFRSVFDWMWKKMWASPDLKIVIVGHSRGGHIAVNIAKRLRVLPADQFKRGAIWRAMTATSSEVYAQGDRPLANDYNPLLTAGSWIDHKMFDGVPIEFLGLYDAVDMTTALGDTSVIPKNVKYCYHAIRGQALGSRRLWGNTGTVKEPGGNTVMPTPQQFGATHGSVGGAVPAGCETTSWGSSAQYVLSTMPEDTCLTAITAEKNAAEGARANEYVRRGARLAGLSFR